MTYLALLVPFLVLPVLLAMATFETRCSDRTPLMRRRAAVPAPRQGEPTVVRVDERAA